MKYKRKVAYFLSACFHAKIRHVVIHHTRPETAELELLARGTFQGIEVKPVSSKDQPCKPC